LANQPDAEVALPEGNTSNAAPFATVQLQASNASSQNAQDPPGRVARLEYTSGEVSLPEVFPLSLALGKL